LTCNFHNFFFVLIREFAAKEKLKIVIGAAPPHFQNFFAGGIPCRLRRRNAFGLSLEYSTSIKLSGILPDYFKLKM